jgi:D-tyrosyl-tRNA(Tyr) deacylase
MRAVVQRVLGARVEVDGKAVGAIEHGLLAFVGFGRDDTAEDRRWVLSKIVGLRVFARSDESGSASGKMTLSVADVGGAVLLVSQFTLYGDVLRGRRPAFDLAMPPDEARAAYEAAIIEMRASGVHVETGVFGAHMTVYAVGDGPVTICIDSDVRGRAPTGSPARAEG